MEAKDAAAIFRLGVCYRDGKGGLPQDYKKALELLPRAGELGYVKACNNIGYAYQYGQGVEIDMKKANHYYELAAIGRNLYARHNLGVFGEYKGNIDRIETLHDCSGKRLH